MSAMLFDLDTVPRVSTLGDAVDIDFETFPIVADEVSEVAHMIAPRPVCLAWHDGKRQGLLNAWDGRARDFLAELLSSDRIIVNHYMAFDALVAMAEWPELERLIFDAYRDGRMRCTKVKQVLIDIARGEHKGRVTRGRFNRGGKSGLHSLAACVDHWFAEELEKEDTWRLRYGELYRIPLDRWPQEAVLYPIKDTTSGLRVARAQGDFIKSEGYSRDGTMPDELRQTRSDFALNLLSSWGVRTDARAVHDLRQQIQFDIDWVMSQLLPTGMVTQQGPSKYKKNMSVIRERVQQAYRGRAPFTAGGAVATDADTLKSSGDEDLMALGKVSHALTIMAREIPQLEQGARWPICARYNVLVESGRTSTSKPNIQNPSRKGGVRECYVARPGTVFADVDYEAIELHALAQACLDIVGTSALADALNRGLDPHLLFAAQLLGITYDEAKARKREQAVKDMRQLAKVANFGFPGGLSAAAFVEYAHGYDEKLKKIVDLAMAERLHDAWFRAWPEMRAYFARVGGMIGAGGAVGSGVIKQLRSNRLRGGVQFTQAANTFFQGLTADGCKDAAWFIARECYLGEWTFDPATTDEEVRRWDGEKSPLYGSRMCIFMHDEFILEVPNPPGNPWVAHRAAHRLAAVMRASMQAWMPDVRVKADPALMFRWRKGCEPVYGEGKETDQPSGCLLPSRPMKVQLVDSVEERWVVDYGLAFDEAARFLTDVREGRARVEELSTLPHAAQIFFDAISEGRIAI